MGARSASSVFRARSASRRLGVVFRRIASSLVSYRPLAKALDDSRQGPCGQHSAGKSTHQAHRHVLTVTPTVPANVLALRAPQSFIHKALSLTPIGRRTRAGDADKKSRAHAGDPLIKNGARGRHADQQPCPRPKPPRPRNVLIAEFEGLSKEDASQALRDAGGDLEKARALVRRRRANPDDTDDDEPAVKEEPPPPPPVRRRGRGGVGRRRRRRRLRFRRVAQQPLRQQTQEGEKIQEALGRRKGAAQGGAR